MECQGSALLAPRWIRGCLQSTRYDYITNNNNILLLRVSISQGERNSTLTYVMVRRFVEAIPRGHASFEERFPGKRRRLDDGLPPLAPWRSNLVRTYKRCTHPSLKSANPVFRPLSRKNTTSTSSPMHPTFTCTSRNFPSRGSVLLCSFSPHNLHRPT